MHAGIAASSILNGPIESILNLFVSFALFQQQQQQQQVQNGEAEKKDDSGNETGAGEQEPEEEDVAVCYDKAKSFFDCISCEAVQDRKGKSRTDWRQERKLNSETFGVSSARRGGLVYDWKFDCLARVKTKICNQ